MAKKPLVDKMLPIWLARIGRHVAAKREGMKQVQKEFADALGVSRAQLSIIENGSRSYTIAPLLKVLAGVSRDPVEDLLRLGIHLNKFDAATVESCRRLAAALVGADPIPRRMAQSFMKTLAEYESVSDGKSDKGS